MIYQTYGSIAISAKQLCSVEPATLDLAGIGEIHFVPMSNLDIWSGAVVLCSWNKEPINNNPQAMYLVDAEGDVHQFFGSYDVLVYEGVVYDLTAPYSDILNIAEQIAIIAVKQSNLSHWWNEYIEHAIICNLHGTDALKYAISLATKYMWSDDILGKIKQLKVKSIMSPIHHAKRLHYSVVGHEPRFVQHID